jgi:anaerobic magnesium-protoporphyrin IX monomethyl ester cyclase
MNTKIVLIKPPERSRFNFGTFSLGVLAAAVRHLAEVSIIDATHLSIPEAAEAVWALNPDVIGVTVMGLQSVEPGAALVRRLRAQNVKRPHGRVHILAGGHGASMTPTHLLRAGADAIVLGEGERTLQDILTHGIRPGSMGVACLVNGQVMIGPPHPPIRPLDHLSYPARDLMPPPPDGIHLMETSRGCPHACAFCETTRFHGRRWRPHSPGRVAAEVRRLVDGYSAWIIHFADDNFAADPRRVLRICDALQQGPLPAFIMASARGDDLMSDSRLIPAMATARILRISVGVETVEPQTAAVTGKAIPLETYRDVFRRMAEHGMFSVASFIIGLPGETREARAHAVELAIRAGPDSAHFLPFLPLPGTPLAAGHRGFDPNPDDVRDAELFTQAFFQDATVRKRLEDAASSGDMRALLARATLKRALGVATEDTFATQMV